MICPLTTNRGRTRINPADEAAIRFILLFVVIAGAVHSADGEYAVSVQGGGGPRAEGATASTSPASGTSVSGERNCLSNEIMVYVYLDPDLGDDSITQTT